ncbi:MAG: hypothetical protein ABL907_05170 [Hyphomicrobium sp.]
MAGRKIIVAGLLLSLAAGGVVAWRHLHGPNGHEHGHYAASDLVLNGDKRWDTDAPLRTGMQRLRDAVALTSDASLPRSVTTEAAKTLSTAIDEQVAYITTNCKLEPKADAALHVLLVEMLDGAKAMSADPNALDGLPRILKALGQYPQYFDHQGWQPLPDSQG